MILTYRYRVSPAKDQHQALENILESQRQLYNAALQERIEAYRKAGVTRSYFDQTKALTEWRQSDSEARSVPLCIQRATLKRLDEAYRGFYRRVAAGDVPGFPRFRGKGRFDTFGFREFEGISLDKSRLRFKGMPGSLRVRFHRSLPAGAVIKSCVFRRGVKGWTVGLALHVSTPPLREGNRAVGIDLGITTFATLSDESAIPSLRATRRAERRLRIAQRSLCRKSHDSNRRRKARAKVRRCHSAIARGRANHLHQASARLAKGFEMIAVEALRVRPLARGILGKDVHDASWAKFISMLRYKAAKAGARVIEVNPMNTTQECSACGVKVRKLLRDRQHHCPDCGLSIGRDLNAARNVLSRAGASPGLLNVAGCGMRAGGRLGISTS
ncbi:MAG: transposase [Usitatibacter sp.]